MKKTVIRRGRKSIASGGLAAGVVKGVGGAALAGIGWKLGMDLYDALKRKLSQAPVRDDDDDREPPNY